MEDRNWLEDEFAQQRPRLRSVAYRMLGSLTEADDAVQEAWLRLSKSDTDEVRNLDAWLTTVVARVCLNALRTRERRAEQPLTGRMPDPIVDTGGAADPEQQALLADSVGMALLVVLETLNPAERLAFVLHDLFAVPFDRIGDMLDRTPESARQLASRARRRVQGRVPTPDADLGRQRAVVDAFFRASRDGDFDGLVAVLDPEVVLTADGGPEQPGLTQVIRGATAVASQARHYQALADMVRPALINGAAGAVVATNDQVLSIMAFTVADGRIAAIDVLSDPDRLAALHLDLGRRVLAADSRHTGQRR